MSEHWYETEFGGTFWLTLSASTFAFLGLALRACLKSRCSKISMCCGMWACDRDPVADEFVELGVDTPVAKDLENAPPRLR